MEARTNDSNPHSSSLNHKNVNNIKNIYFLDKYANNPKVLIVNA